MKREIVISSVLFFLMLATAVAAPAGRGHMGRGMMDYGPGYYGADLSANPNLTAEQITKIQALDEKYAQEMKSIQALLSSKASELRSEWLHARPNQGKITTLQCDVTNLRNQMREKMISHRTDVPNILTPEQRALIENDGSVRGYPKQGGHRW